MGLEISKPQNFLAWANISTAVNSGFIHVVVSITRDAQL